MSTPVELARQLFDRSTSSTQLQQLLDSVKMRMFLDEWILLERAPSPPPTDEKEPRLRGFFQHRQPVPPLPCHLQVYDLTTPTELYTSSSDDGEKQVCGQCEGVHCEDPYVDSMGDLMCCLCYGNQMAHPYCKGCRNEL